MIKEVITLTTDIQTVRRFICTPERILDYYPGGIAAESVENGQGIICRARYTTSLLELVKVTGSHIQMRVHNVVSFNQSLSANQIRGKSFFMMQEDWYLEESEKPSETVMTKVWSNITMQKFKFLPIEAVVKSTAKKESVILKEAWQTHVECM